MVSVFHLYLCWFFPPLLLRKPLHFSCRFRHLQIMSWLHRWQQDIGITGRSLENFCACCEKIFLGYSFSSGKSFESEKQIIGKDAHKAIIPSDMFDAVEQQMKIRTKYITAPKKHLFTNILFCKDCGTEVIVKAIFVGVMHVMVKKLAVIILLERTYWKIQF
jgi:hypothetical protein